MHCQPPTGTPSVETSTLPMASAFRGFRTEGFVFTNTWNWLNEPAPETKTLTRNIEPTVPVKIGACAEHGSSVWENTRLLSSFQKPSEREQGGLLRAQLSGR